MKNIAYILKKNCGTPKAIKKSRRSSSIVSVWMRDKEEFWVIMHQPKFKFDHEIWKLYTHTQAKHQNIIQILVKL